MKSRLVVFAGMFCVTSLIVSSANAGKPDKPPKADKPDKITAECIVFTGDLESVPGGTVVEGCCPNAGPWPAYTMTLATGSQLDGTHEGQLFINVFGTGPNQEYKVQFWTWDSDNEDPATGDYFFQIYGGTLNRDRKAKVLTVTFADELGTGWVYDDVDDPIEISIPFVSFVLVRTSDLTYCEE